MTQTITITKNKDLRIPWKILKKAHFPVGEFCLSIKKPSIFIVPQEENKEEKDWFDEALETAEGKTFLMERIEEAEREYREGKLHNIDDVFAEIKAEREKPKV